MDDDDDNDDATYIQRATRNKRASFVHPHRKTKIRHEADTFFSCNHGLLLLYCRIRAGQNAYSSAYKARVYYLLPALSCPLSPVLVSRRIQARRRQALGQEEPRISLISPCMISEGVWSKAIQFNSIQLTSGQKNISPFLVSSSSPSYHHYLPYARRTGRLLREF